MNTNPFPVPRAIEASLLKEVCEAAVTAHQRGWTSGTAGNFSIGWAPDRYWMSPSGVNKGELDWRSFICVSKENYAPVGLNIRKPSDETPLHGAIYRTTSARCVVHVHPPYLVRASTRLEEFCFKGEEMQKALGARTHEEVTRICCFENTQDLEGFAASLDLGEMSSRRKGGLVLRGHGVYAWAEDPRSALNYVEGLEFLCQTSP